MMIIITNYILRFLSAILTIFIIIPLYAANCIAYCVFEIANNFTYHNFNSTFIPAETLEKAGIGIQYHWLAQIWAMIISPIIKAVFQFINGVKSIKL